MLSIAFTLITPVFLGLFIGHWFDKGRTFPIGTILGALIGMFVGIYSLYKSYK